MQLFPEPCDLSKSSQIMATGSGPSRLSSSRFPNPLLKVKIKIPSRTWLGFGDPAASQNWMGLLWAHLVPVTHVLLLESRLDFVWMQRKLSEENEHRSLAERREDAQKRAFIYSALTSALTWERHKVKYKFPFNAKNVFQIKTALVLHNTFWKQDVVRSKGHSRDEASAGWNIHRIIPSDTLFLFICFQKR